MRRAVAGIVIYEGRILVGRKNDDAEGFLSGAWHIPGETLEGGEREVDGLKRGILEEAGIEIKVGKYLGMHFTRTPTEVRWYECFAESGDIEAGSDLAEVRWVTREEVFDLCDGRSTCLWPREILEYFGKKVS